MAAAAPWPLWARGADNHLNFANTAYARATEAADVADAIQRDLELLDSDDRAAMTRALNDRAAFAARLPIVVGGERRMYDVHALKVAGGTAGIAAGDDTGDGEIAASSAATSTGAGVVAAHDRRRHGGG